MDRKKNQRHYTCNFCKKNNFIEILDLGIMPLSHLRSDNDKPLYEHRLAIDMCDDCGLIQIKDPIPKEQLYINYNLCLSGWKHQPHMQEEVELIKTVANLDSAIFEIGSNDGCFLKLLKDAGFKDINAIEPNQCAVDASSSIGANIFCNFFDEKTAEDVLVSHGAKFDMVVSRHCFEHIQNLNELMSCVNHIIKPEGWLLLEVPDFESHMHFGDVSAVWEEHVHYFTEPFLKSFLHHYGYSIKLIKRYGYSGTAIMLWAKKLPNTIAVTSIANEKQHKIDLTLMKDYALSYKDHVSKTQKRLHRILEANHQHGMANVLYGAGNTSNVIINGLKTAKYFDVIVDDEPKKIGLCMPKYKSKIQSSDVIYNYVGSCFLAVNSENEQRVLNRHKAYKEEGGSFYSLRAPSPLFMNKHEMEKLVTAD